MADDPIYDIPSSPLGSADPVTPVRRKRIVTYASRSKRTFIVTPKAARAHTTALRPKSTAAFSGYPALTAQAAANASQQAMKPLPRPTPNLNFLGDEIPFDDRDIRKQESIDQSKYPALARQISTDGWFPSIKAAYEDEQLAESTLSKKLTMYAWTRERDEALAGMNAEVLFTCMTGNATQQASRSPRNSEIRTALIEYFKRSANHPSIYVRSLVVGPESDNLTVEEAKQVALVTRQYANMQSDKWHEARTIDKHLYGDEWRSAWSEQGYRALIHNKNAKVDSMKQRIMQTWADALDRVAREAEAQQQTHIRSLYYVGYSIDAVQRKKEHEKMDHSTNDLVRFVAAVLKTSSWFTRKPVEFRTFTICLLSGEDVASVAEALVARALRSYHFSAGFNIQACGASVHSIYGSNKSLVEKEQKWVECRKWLHDHTGYTKYKAKETERRSALQKRDWQKLSDELHDTRKRGQDRKISLRQKRDNVYTEIDWETAQGDPDFAEYIAMFKGIGELVDRRDVL